MTLRDLKNLKHLNQACAAEKRRLASLRAALASEGHTTLVGVRTVMSPREKAALQAQIAALEAECTARLETILSQHREILAFLDGIPDAYGRMLLTLRYVNGFSWNQVAAHVGGGTEDSVRKYCQRHLADFGIDP